jgi:predicted secreted protein
MFKPRARRASTISLALLTPVVLSACSTLSREGTLAGPDGGAVIVTQGTPLVVALTPDPTGANSWAPANNPGPQVWPIDGSDFTVDPKPPEILGTPGMATYRFRAMTPGTTTLEFALRSPADPAAVPVKVVRYDVTVKPSIFLNLF